MLSNTISLTNKNVFLVEIIVFLYIFLGFCYAGSVLCSRQDGQLGIAGANLGLFLLPLR